MPTAASCGLLTQLELLQGHKEKNPEQLLSCYDYTIPNESCSLSMQLQINIFCTWKVSTRNQWYQNNESFKKLLI